MEEKQIEVNTWEELWGYKLANHPLADNISSIIYNSCQRSSGTLFYSALNFHPPPPKQCCFLLEVHAAMEKFHVHNNVKCLIDGTTLFWGSAGTCRMKKLRGLWFWSVPRTFGDYCMCNHNEPYDLHFKLLLVHNKKFKRHWW